MSRPVDPDLVARFVLRETTDTEHAEVKRLVAEDPAWAAELRLQALLDVHIHEALDLQRAAAPPARAPSPTVMARLRRWLLPAIPALALAAALAALWVGPSAPEPSWTLEVHGGEATPCSAPKPSLRLTRGSALDVVLRAEAPTAAQPEVVVTVDGAPLHGVAVRHEPGGSIRVVGRFGEELPLPAPGPHVLRVDVGGQVHAVRFTWEEPR